MYNQLLSDCLVILIFKMSLSFTSFTQIMITVHYSTLQYIMITVHLKKPFNLFEAITNPDCLIFYELTVWINIMENQLLYLKGLYRKNERR